MGPADRDATSAGPTERRPSGPTRGEIVDGVARELADAGLESARLEAERLVAVALEVDRTALITGSSSRVTADEAVAIARAVARRLDGVPLQHIEGSVDFRELVLVSDRRALIPRPETEQLVDLFAGWARTRGPVGRVLEIGVGSGAIALSLVGEGLARSVLAVDVSEEALELARENAGKLGLSDRVDLRRCSTDVWPDLVGEGPFDAVVANPPYVASGDIDRLSIEVRDHDPRTALDGGPDGLDVLRTVIQGAPAVLARGGRLFLEIGANQGAAVEELLRSDTAWSEAAIHPDLTGRGRFATARRADHPGDPE